MTEMVERLTLAIQARAKDGADSPVDYGDAEYLARAVLEALREPTPAMVAQTCVWTADPNEAQVAIGEAAMREMREDDPRGLEAACEIVRDWQSMTSAAIGGK